MPIEAIVDPPPTEVDKKSASGARAPVGDAAGPPGVEKREAAFER